MTVTQRVLPGLAVLAGIILAAAPASAQKASKAAMQETMDIGDEPAAFPPRRQSSGTGLLLADGVFRSSEKPGNYHRSIPASGFSMWCAAITRAALWHRCGAGRVHLGGARQDHPQGGMAGLDAAAGMIQRQPYLRASWPAGRGTRWLARAVPWFDGLSHSWHKPARNNRPCRIFGLFRLANGDIIDLYERVPVGTKVIVSMARRCDSSRPEARGQGMRMTKLGGAFLLSLAGMAAMPGAASRRHALNDQATRRAQLRGSALG